MKTKFLNRMCFIKGLNNKTTEYVFVTSVEFWSNTMYTIKGIRLSGRDFKHHFSKNTMYKNIEILDQSIRHLYRDMIMNVFRRRGQ